MKFNNNTAIAFVQKKFFPKIGIYANMNGNLEPLCLLSVSIISRSTLSIIHEFYKFKLYLIPIRLLFRIWNEFRIYLFIYLFKRLMSLCNMQRRVLYSLIQRMSWAFPLEFCNVCTLWRDKKKFPRERITKLIELMNYFNNLHVWLHYLLSALFVIWCFFSVIRKFVEMI